MPYLISIKIINNGLKYKSKYLPKFLHPYDDYLPKVYSTWLIFLCLQYWLFINSHREHRAHGFGLSLLQLLSDLASILTSILKVSFS